MVCAGRATTLPAGGRLRDRRQRRAPAQPFTLEQAAPIPPCASAPDHPARVGGAIATLAGGTRRASAGLL